jgi:hypothetical protein
MAGLKFRVLLDSKDQEKVFRDILISDSDNFEVFYKAIISAFRFEGNQMASFYISNDEWDKGHEISLMDMSYDDDSIDAIPSVMKNAIVKDFIEEPDQKIILVYDFLKMWIFLAELVGYTQESPEEPQVLLAMGMAPPEDSRITDLGDDEDFSVEFAGNEDDDDDDDDLGFNDYEDGLSDDDMSSFDNYDY